MTVHLPARLTDLLSALPETGMGFQVVDLLLVGGTVIPKVVILNADLADIPDRFGPIDPDEIQDVRATAAD